MCFKFSPPTCFEVGCRPLCILTLTKSDPLGRDTSQVVVCFVCTTLRKMSTDETNHHLKIQMSYLHLVSS